MRVRGAQGVVLQEVTPPTPPAGHVALYSADGSALLMKDDAGVVTTIGGGTKVSDLTAVTAFGLASAASVPVVDGGATKKATVGDIRRHIPQEYLLFHAGTTGVYTLTPLTAGTVEPANAPMARHLVDLATATQMQLVIGQRIIGAGGTSCDARMQYATNGATQTAWADANNSGSGVALRTGTANTVRTSGWVDLASGAKNDGTYMRLAIVTVGTVTTAPTLSWAAVLFR